MAYILPQVVINQLFSEVPLNTIKNQNCLVFGPNYQLFRYSNDNTREKLFIGHHDGFGIKNPETGTYQFKFEYPEQPAGSFVDDKYVKLFGNKVHIELTSVTGFTKLDDDKAGADLDGRIKFNEVIAGDHRDTVKYPRGIKSGDVIAIQDRNGEMFYSLVLDVFESKKDSGLYDCARIADTIPETIDMEEDSAGQEVFSGEVKFVAELLNVEIPSRCGDDLPGRYQWIADEEAELFRFTPEQSDNNLTIEYPVWGPGRFQVIDADCYVEYRALLLGAADTIHSIETSSNVEAQLGDIDVDNPLAFGVYKCCQNSADRVVYYMATRGESLEDYSRVLEAATKTDAVYMLVPLTQDSSVIDAVQAHVEEMSTGQNKLWRIAFVCPEVAESNYLYTKAASTDGEGFFATIEKGRNLKTDTDEFIVVQFREKDGRPATGTKCVSQVVAGDKLHVFTGKVDPWTFEELYDEYVIDKVLSNTVVRLKTGPDAAITTPTRVEVRHDYTYAEKTKAIASRSRHYMSRRIYSVFPTWARVDGVTFNGVHLAAAAAGLTSSVLPQQPITNVELVGIDDVPICYETYTRTQLNEIAEGGTFIIMQDLPGDRVYVRHQISTEYASNNLLKSELSITKNLDSISYYFAEVYKPFIGRYNITPGLIDVLRNIAEGALTKLETNTAAGLLGPQVLSDGTEITDLYQDPVNQDHVYMHIKLNLPRPFNVLDLDLEVI